MGTTESSRKFHFIREIASGGFGSVYLAKVIHSDGFSRLAAIKLLHPKWTENEEIASRMRDEARLLGWLRHKNIVDVMDLTMIDGRCAVIMEYLEAVDGKVVINWCIEVGQLVPLRVCLELCAAVASALDAAYNRPPYAGEKPLRVIHRDIKPSNLMVDESGLVKVLDFGVARAEFDTREAKTQELSFGSLEYMPPERLFFEPESPASDVYSLGCTLYEMVALNKFGKAKLRGPDQEKFFEGRFEDLLERHPLPSEEIEDIFHDLLYDMLAFDETERPSAADCTVRMRSFARRLSSMVGIEEWSERVIPPLVKRMEEAKPANNPLVDRVLTEDTVGFPRKVEDTAEVLYPADGGPPIVASSEYVEDDVVHTNTADDARWDALKQSTLQSLSKAGKIPAPPPVPENLRTVGALEPSQTPEAVTERDFTFDPEPPKGLAAHFRTHPDEEDSLGEDPTTYFPRGQEAVAALHAGELVETEEVATKTVQFSRDEDAFAALFGETPEPPNAREYDDDDNDDDFEFDDEDESGVYVDEEEDLDPPTEDPTEVSIPPPPPYPPPPPPPGRPPPPEKRSMMIPILAVLLLLFVVGGGVLVVAAIGAGGLAAFMIGSSTAEAPVEVAGVAPTSNEPSTDDPAAADPAAADPEPPPVDGAHFVSLLADTKKIAVRCDHAKADGVSEATVIGADIGTCTVTAVNTSRKRQTAVVRLVELRSYQCFKDGTNTCE